MNIKPALAALAALLPSLLLHQPAQADPIVSLDLLDPSIMVGEHFGVEVRVARNDLPPAAGGLLAFGFDVGTSGGFFSYNNAQVSPALLGGGGLSLSGGNYVGAALFPANTGNSLLLATLFLTATAEGTGTLSVTGLFDSSFRGLYYTLADEDILASLDITVEPIPEPGTMLLLATGLAGCGLLRRRKNTA